VRVEFFGVARLSAGEKATVLPYEAAASLADVVGTLAVRYPALVGPVIAAGGRSLLDGYVFNLNGRDFVPDLGTKLHPGDTVLLVAAAAGG
jgi:molybdopterin converting factor small subunit